MRRPGLLASVTAAGALVPALAAQAAPQRLLAVKGDGGPAVGVVQLNPRTGHHVGRPIRLPTRSSVRGSAQSPDGTRVAVVTTRDVRRGNAARLTVFSRRPFKRIRSTDLPLGRNQVQGATWLRDDRLVVTHQHLDLEPVLAVVDPRSGRIRTTVGTDGDGWYSYPLGDHLVALTPYGLRIHAIGRGLPAEVERAELSEEGDASLTDDPVTGRLLALSPAAATLLEIDLDTAAVTERPAPRVDGRVPTWVDVQGTGRLLATVDTPGPGGRLVPVQPGTLAFGAPVPVPDGHVTGAGDLVLGDGDDGLRAYDLDGHLRWTAAPGSRVRSVRRLGAVLLAKVDRQPSIIDAATGRVLAEGPRSRYRVLDADA